VTLAKQLAKLTKCAERTLQSFSYDKKREFCNFIYNKKHNGTALLLKLTGIQL
jgi:hypothetical protein